MATKTSKIKPATYTILYQIGDGMELRRVEDVKVHEIPNYLWSAAALRYAYMCVLRDTGYIAEGVCLLKMRWGEEADVPRDLAA